MLEFELRSITKVNFRQETIDGVDKVVFRVIPYVGVVGNTYPFFLNSATQIEVICDMSLTGTQMDAQINYECEQFVEDNFPSI